MQQEQGIGMQIEVNTEHEYCTPTLFLGIPAPTLPNKPKNCTQTQLPICLKYSNCNFTKTLKELTNSIQLLMLKLQFKIIAIYGSFLQFLAKPRPCQHLLCNHA